MYKFMGEAEFYHYFHKVCVHCHEDVFIGVSKEQYDRWYIKREYVQDVFPHIDYQLRELLISGTHPECWKEMFENLDEDSEEV